MNIFEKLEAFWMSEAGMSFYKNLAIYGFWVSIPVCIFVACLIYRVDKKYQAKKREIRGMLDNPDMKNVGWFLKNKLSEHGIENPHCKERNRNQESGNGH